MGRGQVVRQRFLAPPFVGSNPSAPDLILSFYKKRKKYIFIEDSVSIQIFSFFKKFIKKFFINKNKQFSFDLWFIYCEFLFIIGPYIESAWNFDSDNIISEDGVYPT